MESGPEHERHEFYYVGQFYAALSTKVLLQASEHAHRCIIHVHGIVFALSTIALQTHLNVLTAALYVSWSWDSFSSVNAPNTSERTHIALLSTCPSKICPINFCEIDRGLS